MESRYIVVSLSATVGEDKEFQTGVSFSKEALEEYADEYSIIKMTLDRMSDVLIERIKEELDGQQGD